MDGSIQSVAGGSETCVFCNVQDGRRAPHSECINEFGRRDNAGKCVLCGERDMKECMVWCPECLEGGDTSYRGYPGGA